MEKNLINVAVLMGGVSSEREVSLNSGRFISDALQSCGYKTVDIVVNDREIVELDQLNIDVALIALHGAFGEDGGVQELLESKGIAYAGSGVEASRLAMDKLESKKIFENSNLKTPAYANVSCCGNIADSLGSLELIGFPFVIKPNTDGSSIGITIAQNLNELKFGVNNACKYSEQIIIEQFIEGREFTVSIFEEKPLPLVEIKPVSGFYSYSSKYQDKKTEYITSVDLDPFVYDKIQEIALNAHEALGCRDFSRVDIILGTDGHPYILEVNTIPGCTGSSLLPKAAKAAGIEFELLCSMMVSMATRRRNSDRKCETFLV